VEPSHRCTILNYCDPVKTACLRQCRPVRVAIIHTICYYYLCQINTDGDKQIYDPIDILTRDSNSPWNVKHVFCQFHLVTRKVDVSILKKGDKGAIISQVKNWITSWVNYCENEAEYLKSFSLFTIFMNRPDVKVWLGECHSYIMDTYIDVTWMAKKEKLLLYNRLTTSHFDQCTSCPDEHENSSMKWGEMVVNPQQHMNEAVHTINKKSNSRLPLVILAFALTVTLKGLFDGNTSMWKGVPAWALVVLFFPLCPLLVCWRVCRLPVFRLPRSLRKSVVMPSLLRRPATFCSRARDAIFQGS
jgi:hypothetical protein